MFVQQAVLGNAVVAAGADQGNTTATIEMGPDYVLGNAGEKQLGEPLHAVFPRRNAAKLFGSPHQSEIFTQRQSPRIAFKVKGPMIFVDPAFAGCIRDEVMTAAEVMNSFPIVDAGIDASLQPVCNQNPQIVLEPALDRLRQIALRRQEIAQRIVIIKRTIKGVAHLYGRELQCRPEDGATPECRRGITNTCRVVLNRADTPLSTREVYAILQGEFPGLFRQPGNHYASLVTILN